MIVGCSSSYVECALIAFALGDVTDPSFWEGAFVRYDRNYRFCFLIHVGFVSLFIYFHNIFFV